MQCYWTFTGCDRTQQERLSQLWQDQQGKLDAKANLLDRADRSQLRLFVERSDSPPEWTIQAALFSDPQTFVAEGQARSPEDALELAVDSLSQSIDEFAERPSQFGIRRRELRGIVPFLESFRQRDRSREFIALLMPVIQSLGHEWTEHATQYESIELSAIVPAVEGIAAWDALDTERKMRLLDQLLAQLPRAQRQALLLHAVEGFEQTEIADFQNRSPDEVAQDIEAARQGVRRYLNTHDLREIEEELERKDLSRPRRSHRT